MRLCSVRLLRGYVLASSYNSGELNRPYIRRGEESDLAYGRPLPTSLDRLDNGLWRGSRVLYVSVYSSRAAQISARELARALGRAVRHVDGSR